jgi:hypothetical protein
MKIFSKWWVKPIQLTDKEANILKACQLILSQEDRHIEINPDDMSYLIQSQKLGYSMIVNSSGISFSNHSFLVIRNYRENFLDLIKGTIKEQTIKDRTKRFDEISKNEDVLLGRMISTLEGVTNEA